MSTHGHRCRCCWQVFDGCDCSYPSHEYAVCPDCRLNATFYEATKHWKGIDPNEEEPRTVEPPQDPPWPDEYQAKGE